MAYLPDSKIPGLQTAVKGRNRCRSLIYHAGGLGDFVLSLPAMQRVMQGFPDARWGYWGPTERLALLPGVEPAPAELIRQGHTLWGGSPDPGADEALRAFSAVLAFGGRAPPPWTKGPRVRSLPLESFPSAGRIWVPLHQRGQLDALGIPRTRRGWVGDWRRRVFPERNPSRIVVHPGSGDAKKNLSAEVWRDALTALSGQLELPIRLALGPAEEERGCWAALAGLAVGVDICQSLDDLLDVLSRARLYLGNDSGVTHLAAMLGIPTVTFFGPSDPAIWRPLGREVRVITAPASCAPCTTGGPIPCGQPFCLERIAPDLFVEAALELIS